MAELDGWETLSSPSDGDTIDPVWGQGVTNNLDILHSEAARHQIEEVTTTNVSVDNTTSGSAVFTKAVPAGQLSTGGVILDFEMLGHYVNNSGGASNLTITLSYGGSALITATKTGLANGTDSRLRAMAQVYNVGSGTAQQAYMAWYLDDVFQAGGEKGESARATVDSSVSQDLVITITHSVADADIKFDLHAARMAFYA